MNKYRLESVMRLNRDNGKTLSDYLGMARQTFSNKINNTNGADFTQKEISLIKKRYDLSASEVDAIFFDDEVS